MNRVECVQLVAFLAARCPSMRIEDGTPDAWYPDLAAIPLDDAIVAARKMTAAKPFVSLAELLEAARTVRARRIDDAVIPAPPHELDDDPVAALEWQREARRLIADGEDVADVPGLVQRDVVKAISGVFRSVS